MKKLLVALAIVLAMAGTAGAKTFDTLSVDVPAGWTDMAQGGGVVVSAPDQASMVVLAAGPADGKNAKELAEMTAAAIKGTTPRAEGNGYVVRFSNQGQEGSMFILVEKNTAIVATMIGEHPDLLKIAKSAKPK